MEVQELRIALERVDHSKRKRMEMATTLINHPTNMEALMEIAFQVNHPLSYKASWVMEYVAKQRLDLLLPYMDRFINNGPAVYHESALRPIAKICEYLTESYFIAKDPDTRKALTEAHLSQITTNCFDWLIAEHKVATKAYAMSCLLLLGQKYPWIWPELRLVLEQNYAQGSAAYKARARKILAKIPVTDSQ